MYCPTWKCEVGDFKHACQMKMRRKTNTKYKIVLPHAVSVGVSVRTHAAHLAERARRMVVEWMKTVKATPAHTHSCLSSPLCLQETSLIWKYPLPQAYASVSGNKMSGITNNINCKVHIWYNNGTVSFTCQGQTCQCFCKCPYNSASPKLCALLLYTCTFSPVGPEPPWNSSTAE